ncbi:DeoR/GlpR transcriptional regulator [Rheinheimera mesophila]|uniref:DeoR/GlpR transcriptional regulator n=1 Tax=Rheinheimera mesophila TaxID=1547515 RepID=A0A3P3QJU8_9GAMM|nr:transcriptional repressor AgaR [Rheinheimera mesophila]KKK99899.1 transcriptional regulator [Rheinheimera mesophila]RRJ21348.1 DeoR/GlpR transcriptional regulator [Rheinheimera mesophila]
MDNLNTIERQQEIVRLTQQLGKVAVRELADRFAVSEVTIRSDLAVLDQKKLLVRSRGGALVNNELSRELSLKEKRHCYSALKQQLGAAAAALIRDGDRVILDSGTTTQQVAAHLADHKDLIVMTNGLNIAMELAQKEEVEVMLTGGLLRKKSMSFYGNVAEKSLRDYNFNKLILGVDGFDLKAGLTTHFEKEASLNRLMCDIANEIIVVTDSSKFDQRAFHVICGSSQIHSLVTDSGIPEQYAEYLTKQGVQLHIIEKTNL